MNATEILAEIDRLFFDSGDPWQKTRDLKAIRDKAEELYGAMVEGMEILDAPDAGGEGTT